MPDQAMSAERVRELLAAEETIFFGGVCDNEWCKECRPKYLLAAARQERDEARRLAAWIRSQLVEAAESGYHAGHSDTVESCYGDPPEVAADIVGDLIDVPPDGWAPKGDK